MVRIGSSTSTRIGPIVVDRSSGIAPEANMECSTPSMHEAEGGVDDAAHGIVAHRRAEVEVAVALMPVEPVAVVVVGVAGRRVAIGSADGWIG